MTGLLDLDGDEHADPSEAREAWLSLGLLAAALVSVVGLAKVLSPTIEEGVKSLGSPYGVVGVIIALVVLAPESLAAVRNAARYRVQISMNLAYGSAMASIGLTIPTIAVAMIWLPGPLELGPRAHAHGAPGDHGRRDRFHCGPGQSLRTARHGPPGAACCLPLSLDQALTR